MILLIGRIGEGALFVEAGRFETAQEARDRAVSFMQIRQYAEVLVLDTEQALYRETGTGPSHWEPKKK